MERNSLLYRIDLPLLVRLAFGFIIATITGTLLHETAHYLAARYFGQGAIIHFSSTTILPTGKPLSAEQRFLITLTGPLQTILTGLAGLLLLFFKKMEYRKVDSLRFMHWLYIFLSLFWLRPLFNSLVWVIKGLTGSTGLNTSDEIKIASYLDWPESLILLTTGFLGLIVLLLVVFRFIPLKQRVTFLLAGLLGGVGGYICWVGWLGKLLLP